MYGLRPATPQDLFNGLLNAEGRIIEPQPYPAHCFAHRAIKDWSPGLEDVLVRAQPVSCLQHFTRGNKVHKQKRNGDDRGFVPVCWSKVNSNWQCRSLNSLGMQDFFLKSRKKVHAEQQTHS